MIDLSRIDTVRHSKELGKYHILEQLASGPLTVIYKAKTVGIAGFEKIQVLHHVAPTYAQDQAFLRTFIAQAKIAFSLNHRNIVQVFEFGKVDGDLFLATEHIAGVTLAEVLVQSHARGRPLPVGLTCYLIGEVAAGLEYAHQKVDQTGRSLDVVHCDMGPHNIACAWEGSVKILEFGLARAACLTSTAPLSATSHAYLSPEHFRGEQVTCASDLFSVGCVLWELLTGRRLFAAASPEALHSAVLEQPIAPVTTINRQVPPELDKITQRCLERDPRRRLDTAGELLSALHRVQREVGSVIGPRTLATLLRELFGGQSEARDVRQQSQVSAAKRRAKETIRHLVDAAAELAEPPRRPASETPIPAATAKPVSPEADSGPDGGSSLAPPTPAAPIARNPSREGGVLRGGRDLEDEPRVTAMSEEVNAQDLEQANLPWTGEGQDEFSGIDMPFADPADSALIYPSDLSAPSEFLNRGPSASLDAGSDPTFESDHAADITETLATQSQQSSPSASTTRRPSGGTTRHLGERKRFIATCVRLQGPSNARHEGLDLVADIAFKRDGLVHKRDEERIVALFGLPTADENDIVTATRFAFDAREAVAHLSLAPSPSDTQTPDFPVDDLGIAVGVRSGTARMSGPALKSGFQILGNPIDETIVLAEHAPEGQIYVAGGAARLASMHYVLGDVGALRPHGKPMRCYRVLAPLPVQRPDESTSPLVGREMEINALRSTWRQTVLEGNQHTVLILGDAGVGKSRLVDELLVRHCGEAHVVMAAATPHRRESPHAVVVDLLLGLLGEWTVNSPRASARVTARIAALCKPEDPHKRDELTQTAEALLGPTRRPALSATKLTPRRVHSLLRTVMNRAAEHRPLVAVIEDLHWADSSSVSCLNLLAAAPTKSTGPVFLLMTVRPHEGQQVHQRFAQDPVSHVVLEELDEGDRQVLISESLGDTATSEVVAAISRRAGGNPLYIRELCQVLREINPATLSDIPATTQEVITSRVDRLPTPTKVVLQHAAVVGPAFPEGVLTTLLGHNPARPLGELRNLGFLVPGVAPIAPLTNRSGHSEQFERQWMFRHALVQEVIYDAINVADRRDLHRRVGQIMTTRADQDSSDSPAEIARHLETGGLLERAAEYYLRGAVKAAGGYANRESLELYGRALEISGDDSDLKYRAHAGRERVYARLGRHDAQADDLRALGYLCGDNAKRRADLHIRETTRLLRLGEFYLALEAAQRAEATAEEAHSEQLRGEALRLRGEAYERLNDHTRATQAVQQAIGVFEKLGSRAPQARAQLTMGRIMLAQANYDNALRHLGPGLEITEQLGDRWLARGLRNSLAVAYFCLGELTRALDNAQFSLRLCVDFGDRAREGDNASVLGLIYLTLGLHDESATYLERALTLHRETGSRWCEADTLVYAGTLSVERRDYRKGEQLLKQAIWIAEDIGAAHIAANARNALGLMLCERAQPGDAQRALLETTEAVKATRDASLVLGEIPGLSRAARATALIGQRDQARALSRRAVELLETQQHIEGPEQEIYYTHYRVLRDDHASDAQRYLALAHEAFSKILSTIADPQLQASYRQNVRLNAAIERDHRASKKT